MLGTAPFMIATIFVGYTDNPYVFAQLIPILTTAILVLLFNNTNVVKSNGVKL
jgi:hypothetical protein